MEKTLKNSVSNNVILIETSPTLLREIANRIELSSNAAMPQEYTMVPLTSRITLCYKTESSRMDFIKIDPKEGIDLSEKEISSTKP